MDLSKISNFRDSNQLTRAYFDSILVEARYLDSAVPDLTMSLFGKTFDFKKLSFFKKGFGTEEILILGIAAFLLFSKDGDKESAIILLLSLFLF